ncbi:MAG: CPBP family intramembrane glutamic endopeptidase [Arthrobacter sp.]
MAAIPRHGTPRRGTGKPIRERALSLQRDGHMHRLAASYLVLRKDRKVSGPGEWLKMVFFAKGRPAGYLLVVSALVMYFSLHLLISGPSAYALPWFMFFLSLPGNLIIGGMEEAGWMTALQPQLYRRWGFFVSSVVVGIIWLLWHVPLFFIPGTNHESGVIDFWMFAVQVMAFRFLYGAILALSPRNAVFLCILFHTMFNAASFTLGVPPTTWAGTLAANGILTVQRPVGTLCRLSWRYT